MSRKADNTEKEQYQRFVRVARALGCDESEARFDAALKKVATHKPLEPTTPRTKKNTLSKKAVSRFP